MILDEKLNMQFIAPLGLQFVIILLSSLIVGGVLLYIFEGEDSIIEFLYIQLANMFYSGGLCKKFAARGAIIIFMIIAIVISESYISQIAGIFYELTTGTQIFYTNYILYS